LGSKADARAGSREEVRREEGKRKTEDGRRKEKDARQKTECPEALLVSSSL
jgi:hypothetical protein